MIRRWLLAVVLLAATCWLLNLTAFNIWAAGGPPGTAQDKEIYLHRAYISLFLFGASFVSLVLLVVMNIRKMMKNRSVKKTA